MAPRAAGLSIAEAQTHWRTEHSDLALGVPGMIGYVQDHAVLRDGHPLLPYPGFDVCAETEYEDIESMRAGFASEHYQRTVRADEANLIDGSRFMLALTQRRVIADGEPTEGAVKLMALLRAHPASTPEALTDLLAGPYAEAVRVAEPLRHEQLITQAEWHRGDLPACCDAVDILWFAGPDQALAAATGPLADEAGWLLAGVAFGAERLIAAPLRKR